AKQDHLDVPAALIATHGSVSEPVASSMAEGALARSRADISVSVTGIAGPGGGTENKPVGLVYVATAVRGLGAPVVHRYHFTGTRHLIRMSAVSGALDQLALALKR